MHKKLLVAVYDQEPRLFTRIKADIESQLRRLASVEIVPRTAVGGHDKEDLLVVVAPPLHDESFEKWLRAIESRLATGNGIWVPCLIIADVTFHDVNSILAHANASNWYFDIVNPSHLDSLPIRVANLTRMNAHLKELKTYDKTVKDLSQQVTVLENQLKDLQSKSS